jgi:nicotinate-nucleotide adenylyltransferase
MTAGSRLVVLGGTFDPIHVGHLALLGGAVNLLDASQGVLVVERGHRHRSPPVASLDDRRRLVQLAIDDDGLLIEASQLGIDTSLVDAVQQLAGRGFDVHVVFGSDSARHLDRWNGRQLLVGATLWSVARHGDRADDITGVGRLSLTVPSFSATEVRFAAASGRTAHPAIPTACRPEVDLLYRPARGLAERADGCESA